MSNTQVASSGSPDASRGGRRWGHEGRVGRPWARAVSRCVRVLLLAAVACFMVAPSASATSPGVLSATLGDLWTTVLETPTPQNTFTGGEPCIKLGGDTVVPFGPDGADACTVNRSRSVFVAAWTTECSTFEGPYPTEAALRACAREADSGVTLATITLDGQPVPVTEVETGLLSIRLPGNNIFGVKGAERSGLSVAHGWVALLDPLTPGTHTIEVSVHGSITAAHTTTIVVP